MAVQVVKDHRAEFMKEMCAKDIAQTLKVFDLIPEGVEHDIAHSRCRDDANGHLLNFLTQQASDDQVQGTFRIASEKKDYGRMSKFATKILQLLQQDGGAAEATSLSTNGQGTNLVIISHPAEVIEALKHQVDAMWRHFGTFLHFDPTLMDTIAADNKGSADCMLDLVTKWVSCLDGTGPLPRTWQSVVDAVKGSGRGKLAEELAKKYEVTLTQR